MVNTILYSNFAAAWIGCRGIVIVFFNTLPNRCNYSMLLETRSKQKCNNPLFDHRILTIHKRKLSPNELR